MVYSMICKLAIFHFEGENGKGVVVINLGL